MNTESCGSESEVKRLVSPCVANRPSYDKYAPLMNLQKRERSRSPLRRTAPLAIKSAKLGASVSAGT